MGQEPAFDLSDVKRGGHGDGSGALQVSLAYDAPTRKLTLHLLQATDMPSPPTNLQVKQDMLFHLYVFNNTMLSEGAGKSLRKAGATLDP